MGWTTSSSGFSGGGYTNVVAYDPTISGHIVNGGDTFALSESFDGGLTWRIANLGLYDGTMGIAGLTYDSKTGKCYAALGASGNINGHSIAVGVVEQDPVSHLFFTRWTYAAKNIGGFWGGGNPTFLPTGDKRPRLTGRMVEVINVNNTRYLYGAPYANGIWQSSDDFATGTQIATSAWSGGVGNKVMGLLASPTDNTKMFVCRWGSTDGHPGLAVMSGLRGSVVITEDTNSPRNVLEGCTIGNNIYFACGWWGAYKAVSPGGTSTWTQFTGLPVGIVGQGGQPMATGISGYHDSVTGHDVVFVCYVNPKVSGGNAQTVWRITGAENPATATVEDITSGVNNYSSAVWGSGESWFVLTKFSSFALNKGTGDQENIACDPFNKANVIVSGRAGCHMTQTATAAKASVLWRPAVNGMGGLTTTMILADPSRPNHVYVFDTDYTLLGSASDMSPGTCFCIQPSGAGSKGIWGDMGPDSFLYAGCGAGTSDTYSNSLGEVYKFAGDPMVVTPTALGLTAAAGGLRPCGVAVTGSSGAPVVLAGVSSYNDGHTSTAGGGLWRYATGSWTKILDNTKFGLSPQKQDVFPADHDADGNTAYMLDASGVWRTLDQGQHWYSDGVSTTGVWWPVAHITGTPISLGTDKSHSGRLYLCTTAGIWYLASATVAGTTYATATRITPNAAPFTNLQGMAVDQVNSYVYAITAATSSQVASMYECQAPTTGGSFTLVSDEWFSASAYSNNWVAVDNPGGQVYFMPSSPVIITNPAFQPGGGGIGSLQGVSGYHELGFA